MQIYQTHEDGQKGVSNSPHKLARLQMPHDMTGMSVLDIGANEGYFCAESVRRGAARVVGIDVEQQRVDFANKRYGGLGIDFRCQRWTHLPEGPFDVVLWTSAMHYELNPKSVFESIARVLAPGGKIILECGVIETPRKEMVRVNRSGDSRFYPTLRYLTQELLSGYSCRFISGPELTDGDPVPRQVFHCTRLLPTVLLMRGLSGDGKSTLAGMLDTGPVSKALSIDHILTRIGTAKYQHSVLDKTIAAAYEGAFLMKTHAAIHEMGLDAEFAGLLAALISPDDRLVVIEGYLRDEVVAALDQKLGATCRLWDVSRRK